jgi:23S rRNA (guanosine2251-2'-O)-methyltransferase
MSRTFVVLDSIRSAHNVGAIFRTAEGAGVSKIYLTGYTPAPRDRFGRPVAEIEKTSLGASAMVPWESVSDVRECIQTLRNNGVVTVAVEMLSGARSLYEFVPPTDLDVAYIFGNEVTGITEEVCAECDAAIMIPMAGQKESLNVATSVGIVLFQRPYGIFI